MTTLNTKAIRERAEKATRAPWTADHDEVDNFSDVEATGACSDGASLHLMDLCGANHEVNSKFIADARSDVPALCDALDESRAEAAQLRQEREMLNLLLADVLDPVGRLRRDAEANGAQLNGLAVVSMERSGSMLGIVQGWVRAALAATETKT